MFAKSDCINSKVEKFQWLQANQAWPYHKPSLERRNPSRKKKRRYLYCARKPDTFIPRNGSLAKQM